jgi:alpha-D-xyloside xylohydrolase
MPLYIRAGSILPLGPEIEYAGQKPADPIELRIYTGADGSFDLYSDEGDNYDYEKGAHALIPIKWSQAGKTLVIGDRSGTYPGMPASIAFRIVFVRQDHGAGEALESSPDRVIQYNGSAVTIQQP